jgi:hypothetical protein
LYLQELAQEVGQEKATTFMAQLVEWAEWIPVIVAVWKAMNRTTKDLYMVGKVLGDKALEMHTAVFIENAINQTLYMFLSLRLSKFSNPEQERCRASCYPKKKPVANQTMEFQEKLINAQPSQNRSRDPQESPQNSVQKEQPAITNTDAVQLWMDILPVFQAQNQPKVMPAKAPSDERQAGGQQQNQKQQNRQHQNQQQRLWN